MSSKSEWAPHVAWWDAQRGRIRGRAGGWRVGDDVLAGGRRLDGEPFERTSYWQVVILNATGRLVVPAVARWFEGAAICLSWPDSRIWCNQVGALAGTARVPVGPGAAAGVLAADSRLYGGARSSRSGESFIRGALALWRSGATVADIMARCPHRDGRPMAMGYVRPVDVPDERIEPMRRLQERLGLEIGPHQRLAFDIHRHLGETCGGGMNIGGFNCAFLADRDFSAEEVERIRCFSMVSGVVACQSDTADRRPGAYLPLRCDDVEYVGPTEPMGAPPDDRRAEQGPDACRETDT